MLRFGRGFLMNIGSTAADAAPSSVTVLDVVALVRSASTGLQHQRLSSSPFVLPWQHNRQPVPGTVIRVLLRLPTMAGASLSFGVARRLLQLGRPYSSEALPGGGRKTLEQGKPASPDMEVATCWACGASPSSPSTEPFLVCGACGAVQPVDASVDFFEIFGLEKIYELRNNNLETKYKDWQKRLHPDLVHTKSEQERSYAAEQSARVIDAYCTLSKPLSRALYLLKLNGFHVDEEKTISDPELLAEVMDIREAVEEASDPRSLEGIRAQLEGKLQSWSASFGKAFEQGKYEEAAISIQRMTYYERAIEEVVKKL